MTYKKITGTFKQRGTETVNNIPTIAEFAQNHELTSIITVGSAGRDWVSVVAYTDNDGNVNQQMVKRGAYDLIDFRSDFNYNAYKNMSNQVRIYLSAYSNAYKVGSGFNNYEEN
ncbi:hypothetical protein [Leuconostoc mesenteroides]|uniref:hypothetical protein n=1 Tax=Leuconostoc mesenteroides TaxID=1245 RepID=UPI0023617B62|nr:hypothetical protein [Leuconostoc mesenteroides]